MWIVHTAVASADSPTTRVGMRHDDHTDGEYVEFTSPSGKAQVTSDVGEQLAEHYDVIEPASDGAAKADEAGDDEGGDADDAANVGGGGTDDELTSDTDDT